MQSAAAKLKPANYDRRLNFQQLPPVPVTWSCSSGTKSCNSSTLTGIAGEFDNYADCGNSCYVMPPLDIEALQDSNILSDMYKRGTCTVERVKTAQSLTLGPNAYGQGCNSTVIPGLESMVFSRIADGVFRSDVAGREVRIDDKGNMSCYEGNTYRTELGAVDLVDC